MKTVYDAATREELIHRISSVSQNSIPQWGKMNAFQMLTHCARWDEMVLRNKHYHRPFIGWLLGKLSLKKELKGDSPMRKNNPTVPDLVVTEKDGDITAARERWISLVKEYSQYSLPDYSFVHPFFGKMTKEQIGYFVYKHSDHHLRQFNC